ncbi:CBS domain-containing protein [Bacillota bacterium LX-D]|nr:CBS domain-containing protein [Bacillota bacterium LX-D]
MEIICSHPNLDFDGLGAMVAAKKIFPDAQLILPNKLSPVVRDYLALYKDVLPIGSQNEIVWDEVSKVIVVDTANIARLDFAKNLVKDDIEYIIYDHHPFNYNVNSNVIYKIENIGSATTILVELLQAQNIEVAQHEATLFLLGIYQDTGSMLYNNTTARDARVVAFLLQKGANLNTVALFLNRPLSFQQQQLYNCLLQSKEEIEWQGTTVLLCSTESLEYISGLNVVTTRICELANADVVICVVKTQKQIDIVLRSKTEWANVDKIAVALGGGGHPKASSVKLKNSNLEDILPKIKELINEIVAPSILAKDIMSNPVRSLEANCTINEAAKIMLRYGHSGMPVLNNDDLVGIISRRDLDKAIRHKLGHAPVKGFMSRKVIWISKNTTLAAIQDLMIKHDVGRLPVVEAGKIIGIVTRTDVLRATYGFDPAFNAYRVKSDIQLSLTKDPQLSNLLRKIGDIAQKINLKCYLIGGSVRDLILAGQIKDIDIVVEGKAELLAEKVAQEYGAKINNNQDFGTVTIYLPDSWKIDFATARQEYYSSPGSLPIVEATSLKEDLYRRDFTINALALALNPENFGTLLDYFSGYEDLRLGVIRVLHNLSFIEDPIRILRALRFANRYHYTIEEQTCNLIKVALEQKVFTRIKASRIWQEVYSLIKSSNSVDSLIKLAQAGFWGQLLPDRKWVELLPEEWKKAQILIDQLRTANCFVKEWLILFIILFFRIEDTSLSNIMKFCQIKRAERRCLNEINKLLVIKINDQVSSKQLMYELHLVLKDIIPEVIIALSIFVEEKYGKILINYLIKRYHLKIHLKGKDLLALGFKPGPEISRTLIFIESQFLEGRVLCLEDELNLAMNILKLGGKLCF